MRDAAARYQKASDAGISGRETECAAFRLINRELAAGEGVARTRAIGRNHTLWSILVKDLALAENALPVGMKTHLIGLGLWAMRYSTLALLRDLPVQPLIDVNTNVLDGLMAQGSTAAQTTSGGTLATGALMI